MTSLTLEQYHLAKFASWNIFQFHDVAFLVFFDLHDRFSHCNAASGIGAPALFGNPEQRGGYPSHDHDSPCAEMGFEMAGCLRNRNARRRVDSRQSSPAKRRFSNDQTRTGTFG